MSPASRLVATLSALAVAGCSGPGVPGALPPPEVAPSSARVLASYARIGAALDRFLDACRLGECAVPVGRGVGVDTVVVADGAVEVEFSRDLGDVPFRPASAHAFTWEVQGALRGVLGAVPVRVVTRGSDVVDLVPNRARAAVDRDSTRLFAPPVTGPPLVRPLGPLPAPEAGLAGRHVALWPSHGWYYNAERDTWMWQRARLFTTIEDLFTVDLVVDELVPMLERAGAVTLLPRERDTNPLEVIVDDASEGYAETGPWDRGPAGFAFREVYRGQENPFRLGGSRETAAGTRDLRQASWTAALPEAGRYAVHVSYAPGPDRTEAARYTVAHAGGESAFEVNQRIGAGTWVYLGTFAFDGPASVRLSGAGQGTVSADAVRFGGGMGNVERGGTTGGLPRWMEAGRYYEQFAGAPPFVYNTTGEETEDYVDDFRSRGEWVNWLRGAPYGPTGHRDAPGLGIPVDLSLAWHTDAGIDRDETIGTLLIYNVPGMDSTRAFPNGTSRLANRDLADYLQEQIVGDLRAAWRPTWRQRPMWDRGYSEATRANVPSALMELLSHQNFLDMQYGLDPRFRFDAARATYKAVGRFLAEQRGDAFVVQPLRPTHLAATIAALGTGAEAVRLTWRPQPDPLEPSALPTHYLVQTRDGDLGWGEGVRVDSASVALPVPEAGVVRSYRVVAANAGGTSRPSTALAVGIASDDAPRVLVVDGFDRVAAPDIVDEPRRVGFVDPVGVPDGVSVITVGPQVEFDSEAPYATDPEPGWGKSLGTLEGRRIMGNDFDHVAAHGEALLAAGRSFISATDEAVEAGVLRLGDYDLVDLALGLERTTRGPDADVPPAFEALPAAMRDRLGAYLDGGGRLIVSGAHWAGDALASPEAAAFVRDRLGVEAALADTTTDVLRWTDGEAPFATDYGPEAYAVRTADVLAPTEAARVVGWFSTSREPAALASPGVVALSAPIEAVTDPEARARLMRAALGWLTE
ncbi:MAG: xanthan lyase [Bacteroidota bacterium]